MKISMNPLDVIKIFQSQKFKSHDSIAKYVKNIANEASTLAEVWEQIATALMQDEQIDDALWMKIRIHGWIPCNNCNVSRLKSFYRNISLTLGHRDGNVWIDKVTSLLGRVLHQRNLASEELAKHLEQDSKFFFNIENRNIIFEKFPDIVVALRREASALEALAAQIAIIK